MWWMGAVAAVLVTGLAAGAEQAAPVPGAYAILGLERVTVRAGARIESGAVGAYRGEVRLGPGVRVDGTVAADTIRVAPGARVADLFCRLIVGPERFSCGALSVPVVDLSALPIVQVLAGAADLRVPAAARTAPLAAGAYGAVRVGTRGRLLLAGGDYAVRSVTVATRGRLLCAAPCRVQVEGRIVLRGRALVGPAGPVDGVRLSVEGDAVVTGPRAIVAGSVYAPGGEIRLGSRGRSTGSLVGRSVVVGTHARVTGGAT